MVKIIKTGLNIAAGTLFLSAVNPAVNVMNQVGMGGAVPSSVRTIGEVGDTIRQFAESAIASSGFPTAPAGLAIGPNLEAAGRLEFSQ
ncbi:MAG: hypothetical protein ABF990_05170 [Acetobacter sp.]|uniref:hypothetical protein n=1 Tax=Acetobacter sp. TaxID=440 RepID=UPI0039EC7CB3